MGWNALNVSLHDVRPPTYGKASQQLRNKKLFLVSMPRWELQGKANPTFFPNWTNGLTLTTHHRPQDRYSSSSITRLSQLKACKKLPRQLEKKLNNRSQESARRSVAARFSNWISPSNGPAGCRDTTQHHTQAASTRNWSSIEWTN